MPIHVPLLFHFNQHLTEYSLAASRACYRGLLRVLRAHPAIPVNIHVSGTLVNALQWLDPEPLQLIWEGLRAGQFELLGSTYAQNVPYASDDWDNARQIELHLKVLHDVFGVTPVTFWNPERTWRQSLLPIIAGNGYRFTLIEDHILAKARLAEPVVVTSQVGAHILTLLYDDHLLRHLFNFAVWFGRPRQLQTYLVKRSDHPNVSSHCLTYAEDAEAMGLWGWKEGIVPNQTWHRLDQVLTIMEALPEIELIHLTNAPPSAGNLSPIPDGSALWMDRAIEDAGMPYHEPGYQDWFEFNNESEKLSKFRVFFGEIRGQLQAFNERLESEKRLKKTKAVRLLYETALENYLGHQYEFGCIGIGGDGYWGWEGAYATLPILRTAEIALNPKALLAQTDVTSGGQDEVLISDGRNLIITTSDGGRLLYWFDLTSGKQYAGNQRAVGLAAYKGDAKLPEQKGLPLNMWFPEDFRPQAIVPEARLTAEAAPTRMGKYLPDWIWESEREPYELLTRPPLDDSVERPAIPVQRRGLTDYIEIEGALSGDAGSTLDTTVTDDAVTFTRELPSDLKLRKTFSLEDGDVLVEYVWKNGGKHALNFHWCTVSELTPDYTSVLAKGRKSLQFVSDQDRPGVRNSSAKEEILLIPEPAPDDVQFTEGLLALEVALKYGFELGPGAEQCVTVRLRRTSSRQRSHPEP